MWTCEATHRVRRTLEKVSGTENHKKSGVFHYQRGKSESRPGRRPICTRAMRCEVAAPRTRHGADATALKIDPPSPRRWRRASRAATAARTWRGSGSSDPPLGGRFFSQRSGRSRRWKRGARGGGGCLPIFGRRGIGGEGDRGGGERGAGRGQSVRDRAVQSRPLYPLCERGTLEWEIAMGEWSWGR